MKRENLIPGNVYIADAGGGRTYILRWTKTGKGCNTVTHYQTYHNTSDFTGPLFSFREPTYEEEEHLKLCEMEGRYVSKSTTYEIY